MVDWLCSVACAMLSTKNCILPPFFAFPWNSSCQFEEEKTTLIILLNSEIASTFICYRIFARKCLKLAFFSCKMLFSAPKQPSFVDDTVCLTCWQAGKKGCNPWAFTPAAENLKFFFPPVGPFFNHTPPDPRNLAGLTEKIIIHVLSALKTSVGVYRGKGTQQGAAKYSIQSFKWKPATCAKTHKLSPKAAKGWCAFF